MKCPDCGALLNTLTGADGYAVEPVAFGLRHAALIERRRLATVLACPKCDYVAEAPANAPHI